METHLVKKVAKQTKVCTSCDNEIAIGTIYHKEEGKDEHLHSLLARNFCSDCYAKYGANKLISKDK